MEEIRLKVHAKINLTLEITGVNDRGYHELDMLCCSISPYDEVCVRISDSVKVTMDGTVAGSENTAYRAALVVSEQSGTALDVTIKKGIPSSAGLGGSSADASAVFYAAVKLGLVDRDTAEKLCVKVGSDVAYMMRGGYCRLRGEGERITPLGNVDYTVAVVQKEIGASTKEVYRGYDEAPVKGIGVDAVLRGEPYYNVLEKSAVKRCGAISETKRRLEELYGNAVMTGSGSAVFAIVADNADENLLKEKFADCMFSEIVRTCPSGIEEI